MRICLHQFLVTNCSIHALIRDNKDYTDEMAATDNELPVKNVTLMRESVRAALVKKDVKGDGYSFAI